MLSFEVITLFPIEDFYVPLIFQIIILSTSHTLVIVLILIIHFVIIDLEGIYAWDAITLFVPSGHPASRRAHYCNDSLEVTCLIGVISTVGACSMVTIIHV